MKWIVLCNGGPNNTTVGRELDSLSKACGTLESMIRNLVATKGYIEKVEWGQQKIDTDYFVKTEIEAGHDLD